MAANERPCAKSASLSLFEAAARIRLSSAMVALR
jgi:hypothetical protein